MKTLIIGLVMSFGTMTSVSSAQQTLKVDGADVPLATLMENCQSITGDPAAQIACFGAVTKLLEEQAGQQQEEIVSVPQALESLRTVAQYQNDESGLTINGSDCSIQIVYFNNYFHLSRRNISSIDLFSAEFDVSQLQFDTLTEVQGGQAPLIQASMAAGVNATVRGGVALESSQRNFAPRSPRTSLDAYANEVIGQLPANQSQTFQFVLVHPQLSQSRADIWDAFGIFVKACGV